MTPKKSLFYACIRSQVVLSELFDRLLPGHYRVDGSEDFRTSFVPRYLRDHLTVYDVGGGKNPLFTPELKRHLSLRIVGLDIDQHELDSAPPDIYDGRICADITRYAGNAEADLALCHTLLEHVEDVDAAFAGMASLLKPGGMLLVFVPSRHALYAKLNLLIPENIKKCLLYAVFPQTTKHQGFKSYYDRCTPREFEQLAGQHGLEVVAKQVYFLSGYFSFCLPLYMLWRLWIICFHAIAGEQAAETFAMALRRIPA
jgi:2-polyprenyl-6-hydroxyphenyl methylase/3-demethylubiquinone-9 3-methyltransferase